LSGSGISKRPNSVPEPEPDLNKYFLKIFARHFFANMSNSSEWDPKLFFMDPDMDLDLIFQSVSDPDLTVKKLRIQLRIRPFFLQNKDFNGQ
jgi:hypothetical protein